ncbi:unnamed protein product [Spirodela intermedia]|uniref:Uncharacterized protein n=2 Tax=Spirodela intermedia TaxID=51605 RepID=A0A7I8JMX5_SPIIN|nr:unnamed protein product [Spirodela intermedia]CAA6671161.1 unnamed protein product [Spirodela intermedia]CAA7408271.1 unnamed protein product [Spirodela intermedia]
MRTPGGPATCGASASRCRPWLLWERRRRGLLPAQPLGCLGTGKDSPVRLLSSTSQRPSKTTPSIGISSPALTARRVLTSTSFASTTSPVSASTAFCGAMLISADITAAACGPWPSRAGCARGRC